MTEGRNRVPRGSTSEHVIANVKRLRSQQRLSFAELSEKMAAAGRPILATGLHRLENGKRRVDVDDLVALAAVFGVTPAALLKPNAQGVEWWSSNPDIDTSNLEVAIRLISSVLENRRETP